MSDFVLLFNAFNVNYFKYLIENCVYYFIAAYSITIVKSKSKTLKIQFTNVHYFNYLFVKIAKNHTKFQFFPFNRIDTLFFYQIKEQCIYIIQKYTKQYRNIIRKGSLNVEIKTTRIKFEAVTYLKNCFKLKLP